jgi:hypothetical protein
MMNSHPLTSSSQNEEGETANTLQCDKIDYLRTGMRNAFSP